jgi:hypothetical protein
MRYMANVATKARIGEVKLEKRRDIRIRTSASKRPKNVDSSTPVKYSVPPLNHKIPRRNTVDSEVTSVVVRTNPKHFPIIIADREIGFGIIR